MNFLFGLSLFSILASFKFYLRDVSASLHGDKTTSCCCSVRSCPAIPFTNPKHKMSQNLIQHIKCAFSLRQSTVLLPFTRRLARVLISTQCQTLFSPTKPSCVSKMPFYVTEEFSEIMNVPPNRRSYFFIGPVWCLSGMQHSEGVSA